MKNLCRLILMCILINFIVIPKSCYSLSSHDLVIKSTSAILITPENSNVIYEKNAYEKFYPASTTKILTAIVALETLDLNERVKISKKAADINGTKVGLHEGGLYTVSDLLYGLLLNSGNDCAIALAEHTCGSEENFAKLMNKKAKSIGVRTSNFMNASGLHNDNHYTCAYDLSRILAYALNNKKFVEISTSKSHSILGTNGDFFDIYNQNQLLLKHGKYYYKHAILGKTGFTTPAQYTFAASAKNNNVELVAVALKANSKDDYLQDVISLFDYGFNRVKKVNLIK